ncbi:MAG: hypothetical protein WCH46_10640 [bacterium]
MQTLQQRTVYSEQPSFNPFLIAGDVSSIRNSFREGSANPLAGILSDEVFSTLRSNDLINEKSLRDYIIRQMFLSLKKDGRMKTVEAIKELTMMYPYLQQDTIRKIVYRVYPGSSRKSMM